MTSKDDLLGLLLCQMMLNQNNSDRPPERPAKIRCSNCGGEVDRQARFCIHCGVKFVQVVPENIPQTPGHSKTAFRRCPNSPPEKVHPGIFRPRRVTKTSGRKPRIISDFSNRLLCGKHPVLLGRSGRCSRRDLSLYRFYCRTV